MAADQVRQPLVAIVRVPKVAESEAPAGSLVCVGRADAPARGADPMLAEPDLLARLDRPVHRQDDLGPVGEQQVRRGVPSRASEHLHLLEERERVHHTAVPNDGPDSRMEDSGRKEVQDELPTSGHHRMPGIVATAEADHRVETGSEEIDELPLPFITPLGADDRQSGQGVGTPGRRCGAAAGYSRPRRSRTSFSSRSGVRAGLNPMWRVRTMPSRSAM